MNEYTGKRGNEKEELLIRNTEYAIRNGRSHPGRLNRGPFDKLTVGGFGIRMQNKFTQRREEAKRTKIRNIWAQIRLRIKLWRTSFDD